MKRKLYSLPALALAFLFTVDRHAQPTSAESLSCGITQLTFTIGQGAFEPSINGDGTRIVFVSPLDLVPGSNADVNPEIFLLDKATNSLAQITDTTGDTFFANRAPAINGDGTRVAFLSTRDHTGNNGDADDEIFLYDATVDSFTQVTNTLACRNEFPSISRNGIRVAFVSDCDLIGSNAGNKRVIFLYDSTANSFTQITNGAVSVGFPSLNGDGTSIAFESNGNMAGRNSDGNTEIFLYDAPSNSFAQVTNTTGGILGNQQPSISADGTRIAFVSSRFAGGNPDGNDEIFLYDANTGGIAEVTFTSLATRGELEPSISDDGTRIAFVSFDDFTGNNTDGNQEVFLYDTTTNGFTQVTDTIGGDFANFAQSISGDGTRIAFGSTRFANLGNADGNREIFLASCLAPQPIPAPLSADLLISQSVDKTSVKQGDTVTYTLTVTNFGPDGATNVVVNDLLSGGVSFVSAHANKGSFTAPPVGQSGTVSWNLGSLANGDQEATQIQVTVTIRGKDTITNTATLSSTTPDPNAANNSSELITTIQSGSGKKK